MTEQAGPDTWRQRLLDQQRMGRLSRMDALTRIEGALRRVETGDFGYCFVCGDPIGANRLSVDPTVTRCIDCVES